MYKIPHNSHLSSNNFIIYCKKVTFIHQTFPDYALVVPMSYYTPPLHHYSHHHHMSPLYYYTHKQPPPNYTGFSCCHWRFLEFLRLCFFLLFFTGLFMQDDPNVYTTLEQTMSSNPNVYFQRQVHPGMIY